MGNQFGKGKTQPFRNEIQVSYVNIGGVHVGLVECNGKPLKFTQSQSNVSIGRKSRKTGF